MNYEEQKTAKKHKDLFLSKLGLTQEDFSLKGHIEMTIADKRDRIFIFDCEIPKKKGFFQAYGWENLSDNSYSALSYAEKSRYYWDEKFVWRVDEHEKEIYRTHSFHPWDGWKLDTKKIKDIYNSKPA